MNPVGGSDGLDRSREHLNRSDPPVTMAMKTRKGLKLRARPRDLAPRWLVTMAMKTRKGLKRRISATVASGPSRHNGYENPKGIETSVPTPH